MTIKQLNTDHTAFGQADNTFLQESGTPGGGEGGGAYPKKRWITIPSLSVFTCPPSSPCCDEQHSLRGGPDAISYTALWKAVPFQRSR